jgi:hypothetical protein
VDTWRLWAAIRADEYDAFISPAVMDELKTAPEPKQTLIINEINLTRITTLNVSDEITRLAIEYVKAGILSAKHYDDCKHMAFASIHGCDTLVSWNFRHLVKAKTMSRAQAVNADNQCRSIAIMSPAMLLGRKTKP